MSVAVPTFSAESASSAYTGTVAARRQTLLSPRLPGLVQEADFEVGDHFEEGQTIVQLDTTLAEMDLGLRKASLAEAKSEMEEAKRLFDEAVDLGDTGLPRSVRLTRQNEYETAKIRVERAAAELAVGEERIRRHAVVAPFPGKIADKRTELGEWVETGSPVAYFVGDNLRLEVRVPQEKINEALSTESVLVTVQGLPDVAIEGRVDALGPVVDPGTRTFLVRIAIENPPEILKPGMSAVAVFRPQTSEKTLVIPRDAIIRDERGEASVWTLTEVDGGLEARSRAVQLGSSLGKNAVVLDGLSAADRVVVRGNESLREGQMVRIVESGNPATRTTE